MIGATYVEDSGAVGGDYECREEDLRRGTPWPSRLDGSGGIGIEMVIDGSERLKLHAESEVIRDGFWRTRGLR